MRRSKAKSFLYQYGKESGSKSTTWQVIRTLFIIETFTTKHSIRVTVTLTQPVCEQDYKQHPTTLFAVQYKAVCILAMVENEVGVQCTEY